VSEHPPTSAHPREDAGRRGTGAASDVGQADRHDPAASQRALAEQVAERVYQLLQEELRLERERSSGRSSGRWGRG
jgi:hypothetical protein